MSGQSCYELGHGLADTLLRLGLDTGEAAGLQLVSVTVGELQPRATFRELLPQEDSSVLPDLDLGARTGNTIVWSEVRGEVRLRESHLRMLHSSGMTPGCLKADLS